jgi:hypothetical protein
MAELAKDKVVDKDPDMLFLRLLRDFAWNVLDKPKSTVADVAAVEKLVGKKPPAFEAAANEARKDIDRGMYLETVVVPQVPTGVYHLMGRQQTGALVTLKLRDHTGQKRALRVEAEIPGVTEKVSNTLDVGAHEYMIRYVNPPLKMEFDASKVRSPRPAELALKIVEVAKGGDKTIMDETIQLEVLPRDYLPLRRKTGADSMIPTYGYIGAWITSNDKTVEEFLTKAKQRLPKKQFVGEQDVTTPQIKAIYDELKARGMSYVMDPNVTSTQNFVQRTRLPSEVLTSTNAQCLEGTLAFATLMEAIGIKPIVVFVPGHAFVGWHTVPQDGAKDNRMFVETTMVGSYDFELAIRVANDRVARELKAGSFKTGAATFVDIADIHNQGFNAMPL